MYLQNGNETNIKKTIKWVILLFCFIIIFALSGCATVVDSTRSVKEGVMDLSDWDFDQDSCIRLDGHWEFYWNRFIDPSQMLLSPDTYISVPGAWNDTSIDGQPIPGIGLASYRGMVKSSLSPGTQLGLRLFSFSSAYQIYINDKLVGQNGVPAKTADKENGEYHPQTVYFDVPDKDFTITIHVSNHTYARGGFWYSAFLGSSTQMAAMQDGIMQREAFLLGALVIVMLFFFALYLMRRELCYLLVFSCFCFVLLIAVNMVGQLTILRFIPLSFDTMVLFWYSSDAWLFFFLTLFIHMLFESKLSRVLIWISLSATFLRQMIYLFTPVYFYSKYVSVPSSIFNAFFVLGVILVIIRGIKNKREGGWLNLCGIVVAAITYAHDDMFWMNMINPTYGELHHFGLLFFLLMQMIVQAQRIRRYFNEMMAAELAFRQAQIKPHFLYNTLNTIVAVSHYDPTKVRELLVTFSSYLRRSFDFSPRNMVMLEKEIELAMSYADIEKARFEERLTIQFDIEANKSVSVPVLMLQPVIENAIHHGLLPKYGAGKVSVSIKENDKKLEFSVNDDGIGMDEQEVKTILSGIQNNGIALLNIHKRLERLYGKGLFITSSKGAGTHVSWCIPLSGKGKKDDKSHSD